MGDLQRNLRQIVDYLTLRERTPQRSDDGKRLIGHAVMPARLDLLESAIRSSTTGRNGNTGLPSERNIIDSETFEYAGTVKRTIRVWCESQHVEPHGDMCHQLRAWHASTLARIHDRSTDHVAVMTRWARWIDSHIVDKYHVAEVHHRCPRCSEETYFQSGELRRWPLLRMHPEGDRDLTHASAYCRSCGEHWFPADGGVRALKWEIDHDLVEQL